MPLRENPIMLISTHCSHKIGFGHLSRSIALYFLLKEQKKEAFMLIKTYNKKALQLLKEKDIPFLRVKSNYHEKRLLKINENKIGVLFIDKGNTNLPFYRNKTFTTVAIDNTGQDKYFLDFIYSPLPYFKKPLANITGSEFLFFPSILYKYQKKLPNILPIRKVLITFGGSDPNDLSFYTLEVFKRLNQEYTITVILGPLYQGKLKGNPTYKETRNVTIIGSQTSEALYKLINENNLVITSFGITPFESLTIGTPVFLINQTPYHQKLSASTVIHYAPLTGKDEKTPYWLEEIAKSLSSFIKYPFLAKQPTPQKESKEMKAFLKNVFEYKKPSCPICGKINQDIIERYPDFNVHFCKKNNIFYKNELSLKTHFSLIKEAARITTKHIVFNISLWEEALKQVIMLVEKEKSKNRKLNLLNVTQSLDSLISQKHNEILFDAAIFSSFYRNEKYTKEKLSTHIQNDSSFYPSSISISKLPSFSFKSPFYDVLSAFHTVYFEDNLEQLLKKVSHILLTGGLFIFNIPLIPSFSFKKPFTLDFFVNSHNAFSLKGLKLYLVHHKLNIINSFLIQKLPNENLEEYMIIAKKTT